VTDLLRSTDCADHALARLRRSSGGSIAPIPEWPHYADPGHDVHVTLSTEGLDVFSTIEIAGALRGIAARIIVAIAYGG
jgi:hypothetical protein